ncbi:MAG: hypothetical protein L0G99_10495 [Propionibacteriales bacterium]|nr:hypothetical protein [Propionibacteriales bacterium]
MRHVTRHALTGAVVGAAALAVAASVGIMKPQVSAVPAVPVSQQAGAPAPIDVAAQTRARSQSDRANRSKDREAKEQIATALKKRNAELAKTQRDVKANGEQIKKARAAERARKAAEENKRKLREGYDPRTATSPKEIGRQIAANKFGWTGSEFGCYDKLIMSESRWVIDATNPTSGAYGIPQSLPAEKMATEGDDWRTNPATQIRWGMKYVKERYDAPCAAWSFKQGNNWY